MTDQAEPATGVASSITSLSPQTLEDLRRSGLSDATIIRSKIADRSSRNPEVLRIMHQHGLRDNDGYLIPYVSRAVESNVNNTEGPFYRIRIFDGNIKYIQRPMTGNHLYLPPTLPEWWLDTTQPLIITEGEKKALKATQEGFPTLAVGGVWSWKTKTFTLPADSVTQQSNIIRPQPGSTVQAKIVVKVDNYYDTKVLTDGVVPELVAIPWEGRKVTIVFDNDHKETSKVQVQQAAFELALYLEDQGAIVSQVVLPLLGSSKQGLDDFLLDPSHKDWLRKQLEVRSNFPGPANPRRFVQAQLNTNAVNKHRAYWQAAKAIIADLDSKGRRYVDGQGFNYYFENATTKLHQFTFGEIAQSTFGDLVLERYGLSRASTSVMTNLEGLYTSKGCAKTTPRRTLSHTRDAIYYQLSDSKVAKVTATEISIVNNGTDEQLFLPTSGGTELDLDKMRNLISSRNLDNEPRWLKVLESVNLAPLSGLSIEDTRVLLTCLFYMSPWLLRWRGTQLPIEVAVAEPNSGKTFLYNLRKGVLTGNPSLQGMPNDFKAFVASIRAASGLWVCDNLGHTNREYWERLNDELARLVTEPDPVIELRQLYTTSQVSRIPIQCAFAVTSIRNPLTKPDLVQRSIVFELFAIPAGKRNSNWYTRLMQQREEFVAEHLKVLRAFMHEAIQKWQPDYLSNYRLVNFEQSLVHMGTVLGFKERMPAIVKALPALVTSTIADVDVTIQGLQAYAKAHPGTRATVTDVVTWIASDVTETFVGNFTLNNAIRLGRYIKSHSDDITTTTGIQIERANNTTILITPEVTQ